MRANRLPFVRAQFDHLIASLIHAGDTTDLDTLSGESREFSANPLVEHARALASAENHQHPLMRIEAERITRAPIGSRARFPVGPANPPVGWRQAAILANERPAEDRRVAQTAPSVRMARPGTRFASCNATGTFFNRPAITTPVEVKPPKPTIPSGRCSRTSFQQNQRPRSCDVTQRANFTGFTEKPLPGMRNEFKVRILLDQPRIHFLLADEQSNGVTLRHQPLG